MTQSWLSYITTQIRANPGVKLETILNKYGNKYTQKKKKRKNSSKKISIRIKQLKNEIKKKKKRRKINYFCFLDFNSSLKSFFVNL